jgi:hypothetical protein
MKPWPRPTNATDVLAQVLIPRRYALQSSGEEVLIVCFIRRFARGRRGGVGRRGSRVELS